MFMFGAFSRASQPSDRPANHMETRLRGWVERIRQRAGAKTCYLSPSFLAGLGDHPSSPGERWFLAETAGEAGAEVHLQAHGNPSSLRVLSGLKERFASFDRRSEEVRAALRTINAEFCCVVYCRHGDALYVVSDKLGIVPAYVYRHGDDIYYSTALWVLKLLDSFDDEIDWQGVAEKLYFRSQLDGRTIYRSVSRLFGGTIACFGETARKLAYYKLWRSFPATAPDDVPQLLADGFDAAVADRLTPNATETSTLSGGLDSRTVVASLAKHGKRLITFNLTPPQTLDAQLSEMFAKHNGIEHHHDPVFAIYYPNFSMLGRRFLDRALEWPSDAPATVWTGDNGSISIGFLYLRRHLLNQLNALDSEQVPEFVLNAARRIRPRMLRPHSYAELRRLALDGFREHFDRIHVGDHPARYYCFVMLNRVSRMFDEHYETAHLHRIFRCMPFLDPRTIEPVLSADMPEASEHRLYFAFAQQLSQRILEVPWQAYPGHEPCPLPLPDASSQWKGRDPAEERHLRIVHRNRMIEVMKAPFWRETVRREVLAAYVVRDWLGIEPTRGMAGPLHDVLREHEYRGWPLH